MSIALNLIFSMKYDTITITNHCSFSISIFKTSIENQPLSKENISTNAYDYWPIYQLIQVINEYSQGFVELEKTARSRLVITRARDNFPVALHLLFPNKKKEELQVAEDSFNRCKEAWRFYNLLRSQPYSPVCLEYYTALKELINLFDIESHIKRVLQKYNYICGYCEVCLVTFWAYTYLYAYKGSYYVYQRTAENSPYSIEKEPIGTLQVPHNFASTRAMYRPVKGPYGLLLFYRYGALVKESWLNRRGIPPPLGSSKNSARNFKGWTLIFRDLSWENQPQQMAAFFIGKGIGNGKPVIVQPYQKLNIPWWALAYDMAYLGFFAAEIGMNLHMAIYVLTGMEGGISFLEKNIQKFLASGADKLIEQRKSMGPFFDLFNPCLENN